MRASRFTGRFDSTTSTACASNWASSSRRLPERITTCKSAPAQGRFYNDEDNENARNVAFLGSDTKKQLFAERDAMGQTVWLNGIPYAVIGAVVGEFMGADRGLGFLINVGRGQFDTALVFVAVFTLIGMAMSLYGLVVLLENRLLSWRQRPDQPVIT